MCLKSLFQESTVEQAAIDWFTELDWNTLHGSVIAPHEPQAERQSYQDVILSQRLYDAIALLNPGIPDNAIQDAFRKVTHPDSPSLIANNRTLHRWLVDGVEVEYRRTDGSIAGDRVQLFDFDNPDNNDWLVVNQFTVVEGHHNRRPDVVVFINGLPLTVIELKNPADEDATVRAAFNQLQTYKQQIPSLFTCNETLIVSDGLNARIGSLTSDMEWFSPWKTIDGEETASGKPALEVLIKGLFDKTRFLDFIRHFIVFEEDKDGAFAKKLAKYHQFHV